MYSCKTKVKVRYGETDSMGYIHHSNYSLYLEEGRMELLKILGLNINELEDSGIILPVVSMNFKFINPVFFGDELIVKTIFPDTSKVRLKFNYEISNQYNKIVCKAKTELAFIEKKTRKPIIILEKILKKLETDVIE